MSNPPSDYLGEFRSMYQRYVEASAQPPNERQLDRLWERHARDPEGAYAAFARHMPANKFGHSIGNVEDGLSSKLHVATAFGGVILASEAGDPRAEKAYRDMNSKIDKLGHMVLEQVVPSLAETHIEGAGSALSIYLAASAADEAGFTAWTKPTRARVQDFARRRMQSQTKGNNQQPGSSQGYAIVHDSDHVDATGIQYLQTRYRGIAKKGIDNKLALLSLAYSDVAFLTGALQRFYENPDDKISAQRTEDFVGACMRFLGARHAKTEEDIYKLGQKVAASLGHDKGQMFYAAAILLNQRNVVVKGHRGGAIKGAVAGLSTVRGAFQTQTHQPYARPSTLPRTPSAVSPRSQTPGAPKSPGAQKGNTRSAEGSPRQWRPDSLKSLYSGSLADSLSRALNATVEEQRKYPWTMLYSALSFRNNAFLANKSDAETKLFMQKRNAIAERVAKQMFDHNIAGELATNPQVRTDYLAAAIEIRPWLAAVIKGDIPSGINRPALTRLWHDLDRGLNSYLTREYGTYHDSMRTPEFREALLNLSLIEKMGLKEETFGGSYASEKSVLINFRHRIATLIRNRETLVMEMPSKAQRQYNALLRVGTIVDPM